MPEATRFGAGVNTSAGISSMTLARWQGALAIVLGRYSGSGLRVTDHRALEAYASLEAGRWLEAVLWLSEGPVVVREAALADPLGSLLAAIVLRAVGPLVVGAWSGRACCYWRALAQTYYRAIERRPARDPSAWALESLLRADGTAVELLEVERAVGELFDARRVGELVELHARDWEAEAMERLLGYRRPVEVEDG